LQNEFDAFFLGRLSKYPPILQACIPPLIVLSEDKAYMRDIFCILLYSMTQSLTEMDKTSRVDETLLYVYRWGSECVDGFLPTLFLDHSRAGQYGVYDGSYAVLAKQIARVICAT
jgi:hypothetical protein